MEPTNRRGFTLVELLVVIAIVAILAAVLLPVLFMGKRKARQIECQGRLKQLGHAFDLYLSDWDGVLPSPGGLYGERSYWDQGAGRGIDAYLHNRVGAGSVWTCPELDWWSSGWEPRSFTMNTFLRDPPDTEPYTEAIRILDGIALSDVEDPARTILLFEGVQHVDPDNVETGRGYVYRNGDWAQVRGYYREPRGDLHRANEPWHGSENNLLFVDGHVSAAPPDPREPDAPSDSRDLWHVHKER